MTFKAKRSESIRNCSGETSFGSVSVELLSLLDVLVDGRYVDELHDISLRFRGSSNQRIIDVPKTLQSGVLTLWDERANI